MISRSASGCLGFQNQAFGVESVGRATFHTCWDSADFRVSFYIFLLALEVILLSFWCLGDRLEVRRIFKSTLGHPRSRVFARSVPNWLFLGPFLQQQSIME